MNEKIQDMGGSRIMNSLMESQCRKWAKENGLALVPIEPTDDVISAGVKAYIDLRRPQPIWKNVYKAMITAAQGEKDEHE